MEIDNKVGSECAYRAQYLNQKVFIKSDLAKSQGYIDLLTPEKLLKYPGYLGLRPLSSITDDEAIEVAKINGVTDFVEADKSQEIESIVRQGDQINVYYWVQTSYEYNDYKRYPFSIYFDGEMCNHMGCNANVSHAIDYLRSQGFALPWRGLPVEKQIEYGWIKLLEKGYMNAADKVRKILIDRIDQYQQTQDFAEAKLTYYKGFVSAHPVVKDSEKEF